MDMASAQWIFLFAVQRWRMGMPYTSSPLMTRCKTAALEMQMEIFSSFLKKASFPHLPRSSLCQCCKMEFFAEWPCYPRTKDSLTLCWMWKLSSCVGKLRFQTEMGTLEVTPGEIVVIQRGIKFQVELLDCKAARGYVLEVYNGHFALPELGPIGIASFFLQIVFLYPQTNVFQTIGTGRTAAHDTQQIWCDREILHYSLRVPHAR